MVDLIGLTCDCCCDWWYFRASVNSKTPNKKSTDKGHSHCRCHHHHHHCACVSFCLCLLGGLFLGFPYGRHRFFLITEVKSFWTDSVDELNNWIKTIEEYCGLPSTSFPTTAILCRLGFNWTQSEFFFGYSDFSRSPKPCVRVGWYGFPASGAGHMNSDKRLVNLVVCISVVIGQIRCSFLSQ